MSYFKLGAITLLMLSTGTMANGTNQVPTQTEIEALRSTHSQFEGLELDGESAYSKSKEYLDSISTDPTNVKFPGSVVFTKDDAKLFSESFKKAQELGLAEKDKPEWIQPNANSKWIEESQQISSEANSLVENRIRKAYPDTKGENIQVVRGNDDQNGYLNQNEDLYFFISSSMKSNEISDVLISAKRTGATVVLRGMIPNTTVLTDTSRYLLKILKDAKLQNSPPKVIIDPRLFNIYSIDSAPSMVYTRDDVIQIASGFASPDWFVEEGRTLTEAKNLPSLSSTEIIVEEDLVELLKRKYAEIDVKEQRKKAIASYFSRQTFKPFPIPEEDKDFEIDPRIIFTKDVYAGDKLMAKKGDIVNPLAGFEGHNRSLFIIDPRDPRQKSLIKDRLHTDSIANPTIVVSHLDADKQFDGVGELQQEFKHRIYMLQPSYVDRFKITALPIRIDIVGGKGIWIKEYGVETLNKIHAKIQGENR